MVYVKVYVDKTYSWYLGREAMTSWDDGLDRLVELQREGKGWKLNLTGAQEWEVDVWNQIVLEARCLRAFETGGDVIIGARRYNAGNSKYFDLLMEIQRLIKLVVLDSGEVGECDVILYDVAYRA